MEKTRFAIISDLFQLSHGIRASLKVAEGLACDGNKDEAVRKQAYREIKRDLKAVPLCLSGIPSHNFHDSHTFYTVNIGVMGYL